MRWLDALLALPGEVGTPLALSLALPIVCSALTLLLARRRGYGLATTFTARAGAFVGIGFTTLVLVATLSVFNTGLRELHRRHEQEVAVLAEAASQSQERDGEAVYQQLALFRAGRPEVGMAAVVLAGGSVAAVDEGARGAAAAWLAGAGTRVAPESFALVRLGRTPYLALTSVVRDQAGLPRGRLVVAVDAAWVSEQAARTAWLLMAIASVVLVGVLWTTRRFVAAQVANRVRTLIQQVAGDAAGAAGAEAGDAPRSGDELGALARAVDAHLERSLVQQREGEARYRHLVESSSDAVFVHSGTELVFMNAAAMELSAGDDLAGLVGRQSAELLQTPGQTEGRAGSPTVEGRITYPDGSSADVEITVLPLAFEGKAAVQTVIRDISDRRRAEEALRKSETMYRELVEHATYGIYRSSLDDRFLTVNPALVRMLGYDREDELLAVEVSTIYVDFEERRRLMARYASAERIHGAEVEWRRRDGRIVVVRLSGQPVRDPAGHILGFEMIAEDITERRALEEQLRQAQKMEAVGRLTGGIAHDFNNLLTVVLANADMLAGALPEARPDLRADLDDLRAAGQRGAQLVRKLLAFSREERLELRALDLGQVVLDTGKVLRRVLPEHIDMRVDAAPGATVRADAGAVEQIVFNLATNARDAMPRGGRLSVTLAPVSVGPGGAGDAPSNVAPGDYVCLSVSDTGHGMDERTRARIFEPFFTTKPKESGTGLGMAMVYGLVRQHGGGVDVESSPCAGTTVRVYFPAWREAGADGEQAPALAPLRGGTETILLAEDEEPIRRATRRALERWGYRVLVAGDGHEALALLAAHADEVSLVISDMMMPKLGGRGIYDALRGRGSTLPILFISGYSDEVWADADGLPAGAHFLGKPWTIAELVVRVREALDAAAAQRRPALATTSR